MSGGGSSRHAGRAGGGAVELLQPSAVNEARYFLVHTLVSSSPTHFRLLNIHRLLSGIVQAVKAVVKGTESQRRFNGEFAQFCRSALVGLADLEDAVFERRNPGRRAADATDEEVVGIAEADFMKEVAAFLASQTNALKAPYLEHIATSAVGKALKQQQDGATSTTSLRKRSRSTTESRSAVSPVPNASGRRGAASGSGGRAERAALSATGASQSLGEQELGLLDERELMARAASLRGDSGGRAAAFPPPLSATHLNQQQQRQDSPVPAGVFLSGDGRAHDLRKEGVKLTSIEELRLRLEPWKMAQPYSAVEVERAAVERDKRTSGYGKEGTAGPPTAPGAEDGYASLLDVCLAQTPAELLRSWESREAALAAVVASPSGQYQSGGGRRSKRHGAGSQELTSPHPPQRSPPLKHSPAHPFSPPPTHAEPNADGEPEAKQRQQSFFPSLGVRANVSVPVGVLRELVHNGVSSIDFLYS